MQKYILWDQDHTVLEGVLENPLNFKINNSVRSEFKRNETKNYNHYCFSNKSESASLKKAQFAGLSELFCDYIDARCVKGTKTIQPFLSKYDLEKENICHNTLYIGDNIDSEIIHDATNMVHIFDRNILNHNFRAYFDIMNYLEQQTSSSSFSEGFDIAYNSSPLKPASVNNVNFLLQPLKIKNIFDSRVNFEDYEHLDKNGTIKTIIITHMPEKYIL